MVTNGGGEPRPGLDLHCLQSGNYSPNTKRPNWSPNCLTCSGSLAARKRSANWKNVFSFCCWASIPCSISSTSTRLSLRARCLARFSTCLAILVGKVTLRRTWVGRAAFARDRLASGIVAPVYTIVVYSLPVRCSHVSQRRREIACPAREVAEARGGYARPLEKRQGAG